MAGKGGEGQPLIIKKINKGHAAAHGGAWKVAFADFATAMMAFFLLLWLLGGTSNEQKAAISKYFDDPGGTFVGEGGANAALIDMGEPKLTSTEEVPETITPGAKVAEESEDSSEVNEEAAKKIESVEQAHLKDLKEQMEAMIENNVALAEFKDQVLIDITPEGLRIQIVDKDKRPMFDSGGTQMKYYSIAILEGLAKLIGQVPNRISITGHTDATPLADEGRSNWELSADRANAARRALQRGGLRVDQVARIEGFSDTILFNEQDPIDPINRRIAIIVLKKKVDDALRSSVQGGIPKAPEEPAATEAGAEPAAESATTTEPGTALPANAEPNKIENGKTEPAKVEPAKAEPGKPKPAAEPANGGPKPVTVAPKPANTAAKPATETPTLS